MILMKSSINCVFVLFSKKPLFPKTTFQCFRVFQEKSCGANCGANEKSSYKKVIKNLLVTA